MNEVNSISDLFLKVQIINRPKYQVIRYSYSYSTNTTGTSTATSVYY